MSDNLQTNIKIDNISTTNEVIEKNKRGEILTSDELEIVANNKSNFIKTCIPLCKMELSRFFGFVILFVIFINEKSKS